MIDEERVYRPESNQSRWYTTGGLSFQMTAQFFVYIYIFILEKNKMPTTRTFLAMVDFVVGLLLLSPTLPVRDKSINQQACIYSYNNDPVEYDCHVHHCPDRCPSRTLSCVQTGAGIKFGLLLVWRISSGFISVKG